MYSYIHMMYVYTVFKENLEILKLTKAGVIEVTNDINHFKTCFDIKCF